MNEFQKVYQSAIKEVRADNQDVIAEMPNRANNKAQRELQQKHGTPRQFAQAAVNCIGEISCMEAHTAIRKYEREWNAALDPIV